jgi:hypothetical protein
MTVDVSVVNVVGVVLPRLNKAIVPGVEVVTLLGAPAGSMRSPGVEVATILGAPEGSMRVAGVEVVTILSPNPP